MQLTLEREKQWKMHVLQGAGEVLSHLRGYVLRFHVPRLERRPPHVALQLL